MTEFEQVRPLDDMGAPLHLRHELRQQFSRWLPRSWSSRHITDAGEKIDALSLLELSRHFRMEYLGGAVDLAANWDASAQRLHDGGPEFAELHRQGWIVFDGARWMMHRAPRGTACLIDFPSPSTESFLLGLDTLRLVARDGVIPERVQAVADRFMAEVLNQSWIPIRDPDRVAGQLWEHLCPKPAALPDAGEIQEIVTAADEPPTLSDGPDDTKFDTAAADGAFLEWLAWCSALGCFGHWSDAWDEQQMRCCREAAKRVLARQELWGTWNHEFQRYAWVIESAFKVPKAQLRHAVEPSTAPPSTLVSRVDWLRSPELEHLTIERFGKGSVEFAFGLLCSELERTEFRSGLGAASGEVLSFALERPMAFLHLLMRIHGASALLVDMLLDPRTTCLAARLVIEWRPPSDRRSDRGALRNAQTRGFAVQDALSLVAYQLERAQLDLQECAALITWAYRDASGQATELPDARPVARAQLLELISRQHSSLQASVMSHLIEQTAYKNNVPRAQFSAVLDALSVLKGASPVDIGPVVALYAKFAGELHLDWTDAGWLTDAQAARLVGIALEHPAMDREAMLMPLDSATLLREAAQKDESSIRWRLARTLREHVNLLAKAVAGWPDSSIPSELCSALVRLIGRSVIDHAEKGRIGALTERSSPMRPFGRDDGSPAQVLARAWRRMDVTGQEGMLGALVQSDDPVLLAELSLKLPASAKEVVRARLQQLVPDEASEAWTWPELQKRIASLLAAGEPRVAREHLAEADKELARAPSEYRLGLFSLRLQLLLAEKNWSALDAAIIPEGLDDSWTRKAQEKLTFFRATAQLVRPDGDVAAARLQLERLASTRGAAFAYRENAFAAAIQQLVGPDRQTLTGAARVAGENLLAQIDVAAAAVPDQVTESLLANRGLLLLALQRPGEAFESVAKSRKSMRSVALELIAALAASDLGHRDEAIALLDAAIKEYGDERLVAARRDLEVATRPSTSASVSVATDLITSIRSALQQMTELPPSEVGDVLGPPGRGLRGYLVRQVSRTLESLQHMAAMLRDRKDPTDEARFEDDLNTAVRVVLGASLEIAKWDVADQSLGGATKAGNPGERDAVIRVSGHEIAIYEALVCSVLDRRKINAHFDKLLSYGICDLYFLVVYSYMENLRTALAHVEQMLSGDLPAGLVFRGIEELGADLATAGFLATYSIDHREVAIAFMVVDLRVPGRPAGSGAAIR